ncbi:uncharacterized protein LOC136030359 [Artemia franciscana]
MECKTCQKQLFAVNVLVFYKQEENQIHLSLKPESRSAVEHQSLTYSKGKKFTNVNCKYCSKAIGKELPYGPNGAPFVAFGIDKVVLLNRQLPPRSIWRTSMDCFPEVKVRSANQFFGTPFVFPPASKDKGLANPIQFADPKNVDNFSWYMPENSKVPRDYQIQCYVESLLRDLVVVIPTGAGKTLVGTMLMRKMRQLNPDHLVLFVVDRVPLVFQQAEAIEIDSGLKMCRMCGENKSPRIIRRLQGGAFDGLVCTAGALISHLQRQTLSMSQFSCIVVDECHHAFGNHVYVDILKKVKSCAEQSRPRILGLTASPFPIKSDGSHNLRLSKFFEHLEPAVIFRPCLSYNREQKESFVTLKIPNEIRAYIQDAQNQFNAFIQPIQVYRKEFQILTNSNTHIVKGQLRAVKDNIFNDSYATYGFKREEIEGLFGLLGSIELCRDIGIQEAVAMLSTTYVSVVPGVQDLILRYKNYQTISSKMMELYKRIRNRNGSKVLVFVSTREVCRKLWRHLSNEFPELNPLVVVGHSGYDGMGWEEQQKNISEEFSRGDSHLIISTSVLEEGIDVADCGLVIRYSSVLSIIQNIQSRGRARQANSEYVVFTYEEETCRIEELQKNEKKLDELLQELSSQNRLPSLTACHIIQELKKIDQSLFETTITKKHKKEEDLTCLVRLIIHCNQDVNLQNLEERVISTLESHQLLLVDEVSDEEIECFLFSKTIPITFRASSFTRGKSAADAYAELCRLWNFSIENNPNFRIWSCFQMPSRTNRSSWKLAGLSFGSFVNEQTFEESVVLQYPEVEMMLHLNNNRTLEIWIYGSGYNRKIIISYSGILDFALLDSTKKGVIKLYLPYTHMPVLMSCDEETQYLNLNFRSGLEPRDQEMLTAFVDNAVLVLSLEESNSRQDGCRLLRAILNNPDNFPIKLYDSCVAVVSCDQDDAYDSDDDFEDQDCLWDSFLTASTKTKEFFSLAWSLSVIKSKKTVALSKMALRKILATLYSTNYLAETQMALKLHLFTEMHMSYWFDYDSILKIGFDSVLCRSARDTVNADNFLVGSVTITPTTVVYYPMMTVKMNRLFRKFSNHSFVIVAFRDENLEKLQGKNSFEFVNFVLNNGLELNGKAYYFLCASANEQRSHKALFIDCNGIEEANKLRSQIILNQYEFDSVAQYLSRLSLFCTADIPTFDVLPERWAFVEDVFAGNGDCLTDGAGLIRFSVASRIANILKCSDIPSAYQIRISGVKGVLLAVDDEFFNEVAGFDKDILIRKSMKKFESDDYNLGIVSYSRFIPATLNREIITLLESIHSDVVEELHVLQEKALSSNVEMLIDPRFAARKLKKLPIDWKVEQIQQYFDLLNEPFWLQVLKKFFEVDTIDIAKKTKIPVKEAGLFLGVADPFHILNQEEIFLQIQRNSDEKVAVVEGMVIIYRNPCLHPGDVRSVRAVNKPEFRNYKNVLIFPASSSCKYSLSTACSGGDLDGDLFSVVWNPKLVPPQLSLFPPLDYSGLKHSMPKHPNPCKHEALSKFYVESITNDVLGRVAHLHVALCDRMEKGACDPLAMKLAESQAVAVDFPKTGIPPTVPEEAVALVGVNGYPDFMEKNENLSYASRKVLGELYRDASSLCTEVSFSNRIFADPELMVSGYEKFIPAAKRDYLIYSMYMKQIMYQYGLQDECEIILGRSACSKFTISHPQNSSSLIENSFFKLKKFMTSKFFQDSDKSDQKAKASAWYYVAYNQSVPDSVTFRSFAWIVSDILCEIKPSKASDVQRVRENAVFLEIGKEVTNYFLETADVLSGTIARRILIGDRLTATIRDYATKVYKDQIEIRPFGSVTIFTCNSYSDLDLSLVLNDSNDKQFLPSHYLRTIVIPSLNNVVESVVDVTNSEVPHIKCSVLDNEGIVNVDLSVNSVGLLKTALIQSVFIEQPNILPVFWFLAKWAKIAGIVKDNRIPTDLALMASGDFYGLAMSLLGIRFPKRKTEIPSTELYSYLVDSVTCMTCTDYEIIGQYIVSFFKKLSKINKSFTIVWKDQEIPRNTIDADIMTRVARISLNAYYRLIPSRSCSFLIKTIGSRSSITIPCCIKLPVSLSRSLNGSLSFHSKWLSDKTGAEVTLHKTEGQVQLMLNALGTRAEIFRVYEEIQNLNHTLRNNRLRYRVKRNNYHMINSDIFIVRNADPSILQLEFVDSTGPFLLTHSANARSTLKLTCDTFLADWKQVALENFVSHLICQLASFPVSNRRLVNSLKITTRLGNFYILNASTALPETRKSLSLPELECALALRKHRKDYVFEENEERVDQDPLEKEMKLVTLNPSINHPLMRDQLKPSVKHKKKKKRGLGSSFCIGMNTEKNKDKDALAAIELIYCEALKKLGYVVDPGYQPTYAYLISAIMSKSVEGIFLFDRDMNLIEARERDLRWANCYILHGRGPSAKLKIMENVDGRISCVTSDPISDSYVKEFVLDGRSPLELKETGLKSKKLVISDRLEDHIKKKICFITQKLSSVSFVKENCSGTVSSGTTYEGSNTLQSQPLCKLTLHFNDKTLREAVVTKQFSGLRKFACHVFFSSLELCEAISDVAPRFIK